MAEPEKSFTDYLKSYLTNNPVYGLTGPNSLEERQEAQFNLLGERPEPIEDPTTSEAIMQATKTLPSLAADAVKGTVNLVEQIKEEPTLIVDAAKVAADIIWNPNDVPFIAALKSRFLRATGSTDHVFKTNSETGIIENNVDEIEAPLNKFISAKKEQYGENWKQTLANNPELFIMDAANFSGAGIGIKTALTKLLPNKETILKVIDSIGPQPDLVPAIATAGGSRTPESMQTETLMPTTRATFAGANALEPITKGPFSKAEEMSVKGAEPQQTWKETGWWLDDVDGKWRFEIDDSKATLPAAMEKTDADGQYLIEVDAGYNDTWSDPDSIYFDSDGPQPLAYDAEYNGEYHGPGSSVWKLGDLLKHDKLFKNYPELKNQIVVLNAQFDDDNILGEYNPKTGTHKISEQLTDPDAIRSTLLHEIQHAVQSREGFAPGTNPDAAFNFNLKSFLDERKEVYKSLNIAPPPNITLGTNNLLGINFVVQLETTLKNLNVTLMDNVKKAAVKKLKKIDTEKNTFLKKRNEASREYYYNESGEIESRLTQARRDFDQGMREDLSPVMQKTRIIQDSPIAEKRFSWPYNKMTAQNNFELNPTYGVMDKKLVQRPNVTDIVFKIDPEYDINAFGNNSGGWIYKDKKFKDYEEVVGLSIREFLNKTKATKKVSEIKPGDIFKDGSGKEFVFRNFQRFDKETSDLNPTLPQVLVDSTAKSLDLNENYVELIGANVIKLDGFTKSQRLDAIEHAKGSLYEDPPKTIGTKNNSTLTLGSMVFDSSLSKLKPTQTAELRPQGYGSTKGFAEGGSVNTMENQMKMFEEGGIADDGMSRDPVSGNEIPSGSLASEVRDDIPTQLSEGEYVVPADVVRFFGVRVFEEMRMEAKMGLQKMEQDGRIGGEPIDAPAVTSNTDDLSPEEQEILREIMAMEQPQEQPAGFAPGGLASGYSVPSGFDSLTDFVTSPTRVQDQFKTLGGSYIAEGTTGVEPVAPVVNKVCPPGQIFSEKSQMCIIDPNTYKNNDDDGGKTVIPEPEDWGDDIDWTYSEGMTGYVDSVLTPMDKGLQKGLQIGGAMAGGFLGLGVGLLPVADAMNDLSNARATSLVARAMGDDTTADAIDAQIEEYVKTAPAMATSWLGNWLSSGTSRANSLARQAGFDNLADAAENAAAFKKALAGTDASKAAAEKAAQKIIDDAEKARLAKLAIVPTAEEAEEVRVAGGAGGKNTGEGGIGSTVSSTGQGTDSSGGQGTGYGGQTSTGGQMTTPQYTPTIKPYEAPTIQVDEDEDYGYEDAMNKGGLIARPKKKTKKKKK